MAYVDFRELGSASGVGQPHLAQPFADVAPSGGDRLTALEWSVVAIARKDSRASLRQPGRIAIALRALFNQRNPKLADERLEALRRMAVLTWQDGYTVPSREVRAFLAAGFTPGQYETMVDSIGAAKAHRPRRPRADKSGGARGPLGLREAFASA